MTARRLFVVVLCAFAFVPAARAATTVTQPVYDARGHLIQTPFASAANAARLTKAEALAIVKRFPKARAWLARYPKTGFVDEETYDASTHQWTVKVWWGKA